MTRKTSNVVPFRVGSGSRIPRHGTTGSDEEASFLIRLGDVLLRQGRPREAEDRLRRAVALRLSLYGEAHPLHAEALMRLGALMERAERWKEADALHRRALGILEAWTGPDPVDPELMGEVLIRLGRLRLIAPEPHGAEEPLRQALQERESRLGSNHVEVGEVLYDLGCLMTRLGRHEEAVSLHQRALAIFSPELRPEDPRRTDALCALADAYFHQGRYEQSETVFKDALELLEKVLPPEDPEILMVLEGLEELYEAQINHLKTRS